jgi:hypothetical protein
MALLLGRQCEFPQCEIIEEKLLLIIIIIISFRLVEKEGDKSPPWENSLHHVFDATALYEASVTEKRDWRSGKRKDDTHVEGEDEYEDDYTDISNEEEDEEDEEDVSESPSP